jgi:hypothetical protein
MVGPTPQNIDFTFRLAECRFLGREVKPTPEGHLKFRAERTESAPNEALVF